MAEVATAPTEVTTPVAAISPDIKPFSLDDVTAEAELPNLGAGLEAPSADMKAAEQIDQALNTTDTGVVMENIAGINIPVGQAAELAPAQEYFDLKYGQGDSGLTEAKRTRLSQIEGTSQQAATDRANMEAIRNVISANPDALAGLNTFIDTALPQNLSSNESFDNVVNSITQQLESQGGWTGDHEANRNAVRAALERQINIRNNEQLARQRASTEPASPAATEQAPAPAEVPVSPAVEAAEQSPEQPIPSFDQLNRAFSQLSPADQQTYYDLHNNSSRNAAEQAEYERIGGLYNSAIEQEMAQPEAVARLGLTPAEQAELQRLQALPIRTAGEIRQQGELEVKRAQAQLEDIRLRSERGEQLSVAETAILQHTQRSEQRNTAITEAFNRTFSTEDRKRYEALAAKSAAGTITDNEKAQLDAYEDRHTEMIQGVDTEIAKREQAVVIQAYQAQALNLERQQVALENQIGRGIDVAKNREKLEAVISRRRKEALEAHRLYNIGEKGRWEKEGDVTSKQLEISRILNRMEECRILAATAPERIQEAKDLVEEARERKDKAHEAFMKAGGASVKTRNAPEAEAYREAVMEFTQAATRQAEMEYSGISQQVKYDKARRELEVITGQIGPLTSIIFGVKNELAEMATDKMISSRAEEIMREGAGWLSNPLKGLGTEMSARSQTKREKGSRSIRSTFKQAAGAAA